MELKDLPISVQEELLAERTLLHTKWKVNTAYKVLFTNLEGTRYFSATRECIPYYDNKGNYMPFGGGTQWRIKYGRILWSIGKDPMGGKTYWWLASGKTFSKSINGTVIPTKVSTKKEVMEIVKKIGNLIV